MNEETLQSIYDHLDEIKSAGSFDEFKQGMSDDPRAVYDRFKSLQSAGTFEEFSETIGLPSSPTQPAQEPQEEEITGLQSILNSFSNAVESIKSLPSTVDLVASRFAQKSEENSPTEDIMNALPEDNFLRKYMERNKEGMDRVVQESLEKSLGEVQESRSKMKPTLSIVGEAKEGDVEGTAAAVVGTTVDMARSVLTGIASGGSIPVAEMIGNSYVDALESKAQEEGVSLEELIKEDNDDIVVPLTIGAVGGMMERFGLKGVTKELFRRLPRKRVSRLLSAGRESVKEGTTEWVQHGLQEGNKALAADKDFGEAVVDALVSEEGLDAFVAGAVGAGTITGASAVVKKSRSYHDRDGNEISRREAQEKEVNGEKVFVTGDETFDAGLQGSLQDSEGKRSLEDELTGTTDQDGRPDQSVDEQGSTTGEGEVDLDQIKKESLIEESEPERIDFSERVKRGFKGIRNSLNKNPDLLAVTQASELYTSQVANEIEKQSNNMYELQKIVKGKDLDGSINRYLDATNKKSAEAQLRAQMEGKGVDANEVIRRLNKARGIVDNMSRYIAQSDTFSFLSKKGPEVKDKKAQELFKQDYDSLEQEQKNLVDEETKDIREIINENLGAYVRNTYDAFSDPNFKIEEKAIIRASNKLIDNKIEALYSEMDKEGKSDLEKAQVVKEKRDQIKEESYKAIKDYALEVNAKKGQGSFNVLSVPKSPFKQRKGVPEYIGEMLGARKDFADRMMTTTESLAEVKYRGMLQNNLYKQFGDQFAHKERRTDKDKLISNPVSPLNGMYINPEFESILNPAIAGSNSDFLLAKGYSWLLKGFRKIKTVYNFPTIRKNLTGHFFMQTVNGYGMRSIPNTLNTGLASIQTYKRGGRIPESMEKLMDDMTVSGLRSGDVRVGDLIRGSAFMETSGKVPKLNGLKKFDREMTKSYAAIDELAKAKALVEERSRQAEAMFNEKYEDLSREQQKEVLVESGEIIKNTVPSFSRLPKAYKYLYQAPMGDFLSFKLEAIRTIYNSHAMVYQNFKKSMDPERPDWQRRAYREIAMDRSVGVIANGALYAAIEQGLGSFYDEEEESDAIDAFRPEWMRGHTLLMNNLKEDGTIEVYNATMEVPFGMVYDVALQGDAHGEIDDFLTANMLVQTTVEAMNGRNVYGQPLYDADDSPTMKTAKKVGYFMKQGFIPPALISAERQFRKDYKEDGLEIKNVASAIWDNSVIRDYEFHPAKQFHYALKKYAEDPRVDRVDPDKMDNRMEKLNKLKVMVRSASSLDESLNTSYIESIQESLDNSRLMPIEIDYIEGYISEEAIREFVQEEFEARQDED